MKQRQKGVVKKKRRGRKRLFEVEKIVTSLSKRFADRTMKLARKEGNYKTMNRLAYKALISDRIKRKNWDGLIKSFYVQMAWFVRYKKISMEALEYPEVEVVGRADFLHEANKFYEQNRNMILKASFEIEAQKGRSLQ